MRIERKAVGGVQLRAWHAGGTKKRCGRSVPVTLEKHPPGAQHPRLRGPADARRPRRGCAPFLRDCECPARRRGSEPEEHWLRCRPAPAL